MKKYGKGWYGESDRHRLSRLGLKTGSRKREWKYDFPPYPDPVAKGIMKLQGKEFRQRRAPLDKGLEELKKQGWKIRYRKWDMIPQGYDAWKGKNYMSLRPTHWKKLKIEDSFIKDKDVAVKIKKLFRKPYPYKLPDYSKPNIKITKGTKLNGTIEIDLDTIRKNHPLEYKTIKNESFHKLRRTGVKLKKHEDTDGDGVPNIRDARPLNKNNTLPNSMFQRISDWVNNN